MDVPRRLPHMSSSGYVPCAGTVPQNLGIVEPTPPIIDPSHSVPSVAADTGVTTSGASISGDVNDPTHSDPGVYYPPGATTETVTPDPGSIGPSHSGPWQNDSDATSLPPDETASNATDTTTVVHGSQDGIIYTDPTGPQSYDAPGSIG